MQLAQPLAGEWIPADGILAALLQTARMEKAWKILGSLRAQIPSILILCQTKPLKDSLEVPLGLSIQKIE